MTFLARALSFGGHLPSSDLGLAAASLPLAAMGEGQWIMTGAAVLAAIGVILAFIRRESRMKEPKTEHSVSGGPLTIRHEKSHVERHEHDGLKSSTEQQQREIWQVINGLRISISRIEADIAGLRAMREANGERLHEVGEQLAGLVIAVARLGGIVETKLIRK